MDTEQRVIMPLPMKDQHVAGQIEIQASFEICGVRCVTCSESEFTHVTLHSEAVSWGANHQGHTFEMDCFYTKPPELAGKRCRISVTPKE